MLPVNLARGRAGVRAPGYGELLFYGTSQSPSPTPAKSLTSAGTPLLANMLGSVGVMPTVAAYRFAPYSVPVSVAAARSTVPQTAAQPDCNVYSFDINAYLAAQQAVQAAQQAAVAAANVAMTCKRALANANATATRPRMVPESATSSLPYSMNDLFGIQGLDPSALYQIQVGL